MEKNIDVCPLCNKISYINTYGVFKSCEKIKIEERNRFI